MLQNKSWGTSFPNNHVINENIQISIHDHPCSVTDCLITGVYDNEVKGHLWPRGEAVMQN
jgi:hypothetical protein